MASFSKLRRRAVYFAVLAGAAAVLWTRPLEVEEAVRTMRLRAAGGTRVSDGTISALVVDSCRPQEACRCVALIHGLGDSALTWDKLLRGGRGYAPPPSGTFVFAPDLPGTDDSALPEGPEPWRVRTTARILRTALEKRCPRWTLVGNSLGGWISAWIALDWPEGVERLVLVNQGGVTDPTGKVMKTAAVLAHPTVEELVAFDARARATPRRVPGYIMKSVARRIASRHTADIVSAFREEDALDAYAKDIRAPTLILWGEADELIDISTARRLAKMVPGARLQLIAACGHLPQQECPEKIADAVFKP